MQATALGMLLFGLIAFFSTIDYSTGSPGNELFWVGVGAIVLAVVLLWIKAIRFLIQVYVEWKAYRPARLCGAQNHQWDGCKCTRCGEVRDEQHDWNGCICQRCGATRHNWDGCICVVCGEIRDEGHEQIGCSCARCGKEIHTWYGCECVVCGKRRDEGHDYDEKDICRICGAEKPYCPYYNPGGVLPDGSYLSPCSDDCTIKDKYKCLI